MLSVLCESVLCGSVLCGCALVLVICVHVSSVASHIDHAYMYCVYNLKCTHKTQHVGNTSCFLTNN